MPTPTSSYDYRRLAQKLAYSRDHFEEAEPLFGADPQNQSLPDLKARWQQVLAEGSALAGWVQHHHRAQSAGVYAALEELAKYADVRRPFRLSVIGKKGVGK